jgi:N6-adenosine-specific RNA methylase IME4
VRELIVTPRNVHSLKPDEAYRRTEALYPGPYLELFARKRRPGWDYELSPELDTGPAPRRWASNSYPQAAE